MKHSPEDYANKNPWPLSYKNTRVSNGLKNTYLIRLKTENLFENIKQNTKNKYLQLINYFERKNSIIFFAVYRNCSTKCYNKFEVFSPLTMLLHFIWKRFGNKHGAEKIV